MDDGRAGKEPLYGYPLVADPRDFAPDEECCTPEEIAAWRADVARAEAGQPVERAGPYYWVPDEAGNPGARAVASRWGIGVNWLDAEAG